MALRFRISLWSLAWVILGRSIFSKSNKKVGKVTANDFGKIDLLRITHAKFHNEILILSAIRDGGIKNPYLQSYIPTECM